MDRLVLIFIWPFLFGLVSGPADGQGRATKLLALKLLPQEGGFLAILQADGPMEHRVVEEQNPAQRLVLDVLGVSDETPGSEYSGDATHGLRNYFSFRS